MPQSLEDRTERPEEPLFLHQEVTLEAFRTAIELSEEEVPVAGMGSQTDNILVGVSLRYLGGPPHTFVK
jgi:hypothetical protein